jgi:hypothetical protein
MGGLLIVAFGLAIFLFGGQGDAPPTGDNDSDFDFCDDLESKPIFNYTLKYSGETVYYFNGTDSDDKLYLYTVHNDGSYSIEDATMGFEKTSYAWQMLYDHYLEDAKEKGLVSSQGYCWLKRMIYWIEGF